MTKPAPKLPTIQDLTREELLRLVSLVYPVVHTATILRAQLDVVAAQQAQAEEALLVATDNSGRAAARWQECLQRRAPQSVTDKARRAYLAANNEYEAARTKADRLFRRSTQLHVRYMACLTKGA